MALQNAKDMFVLDSYYDFSPTKQLTHNGLNLYGKLLHTLLVRSVFSRNLSCELVTYAHLILMWKVASIKTVDYTSLIISTMRFCSSPLRNNALPYANLSTIIFYHFNLLSDLEEVDYSHLSLTEKEDLQKIHGKKLSRLEPQLKEHTTHSRLQSFDS